MLEWLRFRRDLARINAWERRVRRTHQQKIEEAARERTEPPDEGALGHDLWTIDGDRSVILSRRLLKKAYRMGVPMPDHDDKEAWKETHHSYERYLSVKAAAALRSAIRKEITERWELRLKIMGIMIPGLIGAIGALTGLAAIILK